MIDSQELQSALTELYQQLKEPARQIEHFDIKELVLLELSEQLPKPIGRVLLEILNDLKNV